MAQVKPRREPAADLGPQIRVLRGEVIAEFRADPDKPQGTPVRGGRAAQGGHDYLFRRGSLDTAQHRAAELYCAAWHAVGASQCSLPSAEATSRRAPHEQSVIAHRKLAAAMTLRCAKAVLGPAAVFLVQRVTIRGDTLGTIGGAAGEGDQVTLGRLRAALDRLCEEWEIE
jgi:hypothetical protein